MVYVSFDLLISEYVLYDQMWSVQPSDSLGEQTWTSLSVLIKFETFPAHTNGSRLLVKAEVVTSITGADICKNVLLIIIWQQLN